MKTCFRSKVLFFFFSCKENKCCLEDRIKKSFSPQTGFALLCTVYWIKSIWALSDAAQMQAALYLKGYDLLSIFFLLLYCVKAVKNQLSFGLSYWDSEGTWCRLSHSTSFLQNQFWSFRKILLSAAWKYLDSVSQFPFNWSPNPTSY